MYPFIVCFCGRSLGDLYDAFKAMRKAEYMRAYDEEELDVDPSVLAIMGDINVDLTDVFDQLCINMQCCKEHIATQVEFKDFY